MKRKLIFLLVLLYSLAALSARFTAMAAEPPTGAEIVMSAFFFDIRNDNLNFKDDLKVTFRDIATDKKYQMLLKYSAQYGAGKAYGLVANTTYQIDIAFDHSDLYEIRNADGSAADAVHAVEAGFTLEWLIVKKDSDNGAASDLPKEIQDKMLLVSQYVSAAQWIENDPGFEPLLKVWAAPAVYKEKYVKDGYTEDSWEAMSGYERFSYILLYTMPFEVMKGENAAIFATDLDKYLHQLDLLIPKAKMERMDNGLILYNALTEVWEWHYTNWETQRIFINPFEGYDFHAVLKGDTLMSYETPAPAAHEDAAPDIESAADALSDTAAPPVDAAAELGPAADAEPDAAEWEETAAPAFGAEDRAQPHYFAAVLLKNIVTIVLLVIVGIILFLVVRHNKKRNFG